MTPSATVAAMPPLFPAVAFDPAAIADVGAAFDDAGYTEPRVCERWGVREIYDLKPLSDGRERRPVADTLDLMVRLFFDSEAVARGVVEKMLGASAAAFHRLGLLERAPRDRIAATVLIYPTGPLRIVSDLRTACAYRGRSRALADAVYPAITPNSRLFRAGLPRTRSERLIELCSGTGIAALLGADCTNHAWAADITGRSTLFADFNARLNGIDNFTAVQGDLYEAVPGATFDCIIAHPPYVPAVRQEMVYRDGGNDGEWITRRIIEQLPDYLEPGGLFYCTCGATDRKDAPLEERVRAMLGERESQFDIAVIPGVVHDAVAYSGELMTDPTMKAEEARHTVRMFRALGVQNVVIGSIIMRRHDTPKPALTLRRPLGTAPAAAAVDLAFAWERISRDPAKVERLLDSRPRVARDARRQFVHRRTDSGWTVESCRYSVESPFSASLEPSQSAVGFIEGCDGTHTVRELVARMRAEGRLPAAMPDLRFAEMVCSLTGGGFLDAGEPWPALTGH